MKFNKLWFFFLGCIVTFLVTFYYFNHNVPKPEKDVPYTTMWRQSENEALMLSENDMVFDTQGNIIKPRETGLEGKNQEYLLSKGEYRVVLNFKDATVVSGQYSSVIILQVE